MPNFIPLSVQFSCSVVSNSLQPHGLQHARLPCPSPTPGACTNSCPYSRWCHQTISSSVISFSSCLKSFPASGSFPMSQLFTSGGQIIEVSALKSICPSKEYSGLISFRIEWLDLLAVQRTLKSLLQQHSSKASILQCSAFFIVQLSMNNYNCSKTNSDTQLVRNTEMNIQISAAGSYLQGIINWTQPDNFFFQTKFICITIHKSIVFSSISFL